jgi:hypothetical protein
MNHAFDCNEVLEISGDLAETVKSYLTAGTTDEVLDFEIYENNLGDRCVAVALQTEFWGKAVVQGAIVVVRPRPEEGANAYLVSAIAEDEGPYAASLICCPRPTTNLPSIGGSDAESVSLMRLWSRPRRRSIDGRRC